MLAGDLTRGQNAYLYKSNHWEIFDALTDTWHFHIKKLDEGINFINRALYKNGQELHYAAIEYKGYMFWDIEGNMKDISLEKKLQGLKELAEIKSINFKSNLIAQDLVIQSAQEFKITILADDTKNIYLSSYQSQPELKIKFRKNALLLEIAHEISNQMDYVVENIQEVDFVMFLDAANIWGVDYDSSIDDDGSFRSSFGVGIDWMTPIGPLNFIFAQPITKESSDKTQTFRFNLGTTF